MKQIRAVLTLFPEFLPLHTYRLAYNRILNRTQDRLWLIFWDIDWLISSSTIREELLRGKHQDFLDDPSPHSQEM